MFAPSVRRTEELATAEGFGAGVVVVGVGAGVELDEEVEALIGAGVLFFAGVGATFLSAWATDLAGVDWSRTVVVVAGVDEVVAAMLTTLVVVASVVAGATVVVVVEFDVVIATVCVFTNSVVPT